MPVTGVRLGKIVLMSIVSLAIIALRLTAFATRANAAPAQTTTGHLAGHALRKGQKTTQVQPNGGSRCNPAYHGGSVFHTNGTYAIYWEPSTLQNGSATHVSSGFNSLISRYFQAAGGSGLYHILTQ
jgi:hypothetical protein